MTIYKTILLTITVLLTSTPAKAQQFQASLSHYTTDNGLCSNAVAEIKQDDFGYIWIATWNGLSRFDGFNFYNYRTGNGSHIPNLHNRIENMTFDYAQNIWMRMYDGRIFVLNRLRDTFINPFENVSNSEDYRTLYPLFRMSNGDILAIIDGVGIYKMRLDKDTPIMQLITTGKHAVKCIAEGYHNDIWAGTDHGLFRVDISNLSTERKGLFENENITALFSNGYNIYVGCASGNIYLYSYGQEPKIIRNGTGLSVLSVFLDSQGLIWFADSRFGVNKIDLTTGVERHYEHRVLIPEYDATGGIFKENNGTLWIRMNHGGYGYYNRETDEVEYFHNDPTNPWNLPNTVHASCELPEGVVFLSTSRKALEKLDILKNTISRTLLVPNAETPVENEIRGIYYDKKHKQLFIGNKNNTLFVINNDGSRTTIHTDSQGNPIGRIYGISKDNEDNIWISSKDHGVFKMTRQNGGFHIQNFCHDPNNKYSLSSNAAYQTVADKKGNIWVATYAQGVNVITRDKNGKTVILNVNNEMRQYPHNSFLKVRSIALANDGKIWAGTSDGILTLSLEGKKVNIEKIKNSKEEPEKILQCTDIIYLAKDNNGDMWVGTNGGGIAHAIGQDSNGAWLFDSFGIRDGLPSEEIKSIAFDLNNNVWMATDHMICSFNPSKRIFTIFSNLDGVDETICSEGAAITLPNGNILFGTLKGYYTVDRKKLVTKNASILKLRITDFFLNDELVSPQLNDYYDYYVPDAKEVKLPNHNFSFGFRFAAMNFQLQHRIHYQYMLEGYDQDWRNPDKTHIANYIDIPTGKYRFKVKAFLLDSPDKFDQRIITVTVPPYFLLSSNAIWLYMAITLILSIALMFWRQNNIKKKQNLKVLKLGPEEMAFVHEEDYQFMKSQLEWMEANFTIPDLKIDDLVAQSGLSREAYFEQMKELTGFSPKEFINDFRMKKAIMFLENTSVSITDIAQKTGFSDPNTFARIFKQITGITPSKYREQKKQKSEKDQQQNQETENDTEATDSYEIIE